MIYTSPDADIFILSDNKIQIRKLDFKKGSAEILEIGGEDAGDLAKILPEIWENGATKQRFVDFFEEKYSENQVDETIEALKVAGVVSEEKTNNLFLLHPFFLDEISSGVFFFRIDCSIFVIQAESEKEAHLIFHKVARRWGSKCDLDIFKELQEKSLKTLPAKGISRSVLTTQLAGNYFGSVTSFKIKKTNGDLSIIQFDPFEEAKKAITDPNGYWGRFISRTIDDSGLISSVQEMRVVPEPFHLSKKFFHVMHVLTDLNGKAVNDSQLGAGDTREEACGKAIMETLERYCCRKRPVNLIKANLRDISDKRVIDPRRLACYLETQLEQVHDLRNFHEGDDDFWTEMSDGHGKTWLIPASHVWYCFCHSDFTGGKSLFWASTNGAAAHFSFEKAAFSAIRELVERDAIMIWWINRLSPPIMETSLLGKDQAAIVNKIETCGFEVRLLDLTLDLLPVVMAVAKSKKGEKPYFFCGASCHESFSGACDKALQELEQTVWSRLGQEVVELNPRDMDMPLDHEMFYLIPENGNKLDFLFNGNRQCEPRNSVEFGSLQEIVAYFEERGLCLFLKDITCDEVKKAELGVHVVKAVIPDLVPITFGYMTETLGLRRIYDIPMRLGLRSEILTESEVLNNYQPHFFP